MENDDMETPLALTTEAAQQALFRKIPEAERGRVAAEVLMRYAEGEKIPDIAKQRGVSPATLYALLVSQHPDAWKQVQVGRALDRLAKAEADMDASTDGFKLAKAEKIVKSCQWALERLFRELYAEDRPPSVQVNLITDPAQARARIIELERKLGVRGGLADREDEIQVAGEAEK
jgi:Helix-turn-helix domain of resolvase